jgi:predicted ATPase
MDEGMRLERALSHYLRSISVRWDDVEDRGIYPFDLPVIRELKEINFSPTVTYIVGDNGTGKSTLLEAIAVAVGFNPEGGSRNMNFSTIETHSSLATHLHAIRGATPHDGYFLRAESFYNVASKIDELDVDPLDVRLNEPLPPLIDSYGGRSLHKQSHGESFWALFTERFRGNGLYILDEPEAALSPTRQLAFLLRMQDLVKAGSQFLIATHAPIVLSYPGALIYELRDGELLETALEDTETFNVTRSFLANREAALDELLNKDEDAE